MSERMGPSGDRCFTNHISNRISTAALSAELNIPPADGHAFRARAAEEDLSSTVLGQSRCADCGAFKPISQ